MCPICKQDFTWADYNNGDVIERYNLAWHKACAIRVLESLGSGEIESPQTYSFATRWETISDWFKKVEFQDRLDVLRLWQMVKGDLFIEVNNSRMYLNMELSEELWPILKRFAETGELTK